MFDPWSLILILSNGENVEGATHKHVVNLIKKGGDKLTLVVISVSQHAAEKLDSDSSSGGEDYDYSDKCVIPLSIPEMRQVTSNGETYMVGNASLFTLVPRTQQAHLIFCLLRSALCLG